MLTGPFRHILQSHPFGRVYVRLQVWRTNRWIVCGIFEFTDEQWEEWSVLFDANGIERYEEPAKLSA